MDITLYLFTAKVGLIAFMIALFYNEDKDIQLIFNIVAFIILTALALLAFNIETTTYSGSAWVSNSVVEYSYVIFSLMFSIISFIHGFVLIMERMHQTIEQSVEGLTFNTFEKPKRW